VAEPYTRTAVGATHGAVRGVVTLVEIVRCKQWPSSEAQQEEECKSAHDVRRKVAVTVIATGMPFPRLGIKPKEML
jgi:hypothetical protein